MNNPRLNVASFKNMSLCNIYSKAQLFALASLSYICGHGKQLGTLAPSRSSETFRADEALKHSKLSLGAKLRRSGFLILLRQISDTYPFRH